MNTKSIYAFLRWLDARGVSLFDMHDLRVWFRESVPTLNRGLAQHVADGLIMRVTRGLYCNAMPSSRPLYAREALVPYLRPLEINYESHESMLSAYGVISQLPTRLTMATTGGSGIFTTPVGVIEFTHVRQTAGLHKQLLWDDRRNIWMASPVLAYDDLQRSRRNLHLVDLEEFEEAKRDFKISQAL